MNNWISVMDREPNETGAVLITNGYSVLIGSYISYRGGGGKWAKNAEGLTHWMLLPELPKEQGNV